MLWLTEGGRRPTGVSHNIRPKIHYCDNLFVKKGGYHKCVSKNY